MNRLSGDAKFFKSVVSFNNVITCLLHASVTVKFSSFDSNEEINPLIIETIIVEKSIVTLFGVVFRFSFSKHNSTNAVISAETPLE